MTVLLSLCSVFYLRADVTVQTFQDLNNNGIKDDGEELITGLTVEAIDALGNPRPFIEISEGSFTLPGIFIESRLRVRVTAMMRPSCKVLQVHLPCFLLRMGSRS